MFIVPKIEPLWLIVLWHLSTAYRKTYRSIRWDYKVFEISYQYNERYELGLVGYIKNSVVLSHIFYNRIKNPKMYSSQIGQNLYISSYVAH